MYDGYSYQGTVSESIDVALSLLITTQKIPNSIWLCWSLVHNLFFPLSDQPYLLPNQISCIFCPIRSAVSFAQSDLPYLLPNHIAVSFAQSDLPYLLPNQIAVSFAQSDSPYLLPNQIRPIFWKFLFMKAAKILVYGNFAACGNNAISG